MNVVSVERRFVFAEVVIVEIAIARFPAANSVTSNAEKLREKSIVPLPTLFTTTVIGKSAIVNDSARRPTARRR